jgi:UDP-glucose 4-epimerase
VSHTASDTPVNLAFGTRTSLLEVIQLLEGIVGRPLDIDFVDQRAGDVPHSQADQTRFRSLFPDVHAVPLGDGLRATVDWFRSTQAALHV